MLGLILGAALVAVVVVATGGVGAVAAGALIATGALSGEYIGGASTGPATGAIVIGAPKVHTNGKPAGMAVFSMAPCAKEYGVPQPVAEGSKTVYIQGFPAARKNDKLVCGAVITAGSSNVFIGGETKPMLPIKDEVPFWLHTTLQVVALAGLGPGFAALKAAVGYGAAIAGVAGGFGGSYLLGKGGRALGESLGLSESATRALEVGGSLGGGVVGGAAGIKVFQRLAPNPAAARGGASESKQLPIASPSGERVPGLNSGQVPGGGLQVHEDAGGHLLQKHVGKTEIELQNRLNSEPRISGSSSFHNRTVAENSVSRTIDANQPKIADWLSGNNPRLRIDATLSESTGISVTRSTAGAVDVNSTRLILVRDPNLATGYRILTGFPTPP